ncbi:MAG: HlyD family efflux transporter periplasmic adaptor subunit [Mariniblastus sp.]|nr:HlyD family efflux transporter periplasmic adaptor subunit [Mariniblastus sp.]MDG2182745.1 HlyD family efflux transporter periplasmic adaptor subunit [Mariniblastus sp.]
MSQSSPQSNTPHLGNFIADPLGPPAPHHQPSIPQTPSASPPQQPSGDDQQKQTGGVHPGLVNQTKNQIRILVDEIRQLAHANSTVDEFMDGFTPRITTALASVGAAIWLIDSESGTLALKYYVNVPPVLRLNDQAAAIEHQRLLKKTLDTQQASLVQPASGGYGDKPTGNPTDHLLILQPLTIDKTAVGLVEIFQRPGAGLTTQRGYLKFVSQMGDIASEFLSNQKIRSYSVERAMWNRREQFIGIIHQSLNTQEVAYAIANEGRRFLECDRVSVATGHDRQCRVDAVSGLDTVERRATQVKQLSQLASLVMQTSEPLWYSGSSDNLPPQIREPLHEYVDRSHTKMLAILPLFRENNHPSDSALPEKKPIAVGALIVEQLSDSRIAPKLKNNIETIAIHCQSALSNATEHHQIFLLPAWKMIGQFVSLFQSGRRTKTISIIGMMAVLLIFLTCFPCTFGLGAKGSLIPTEQHEVFAKINGTMETIFVSDDGDTLVQQGQPLAQMQNSDLELAIDQINGQIAIQEAERNSNLQLQNRNDLSQFESVEVNNNIALATKTIEYLRRELEIRMEEQQLLTVTSPATGRVVNWNAKQNLMHRPVTRGQNLMTIVNPNTEWIVELEMPERRLGHLSKAMRDSEQPLQVTFALLSNPGTEYTGVVLDIDEKLDVHSDEGNTALVRVQFPNEAIDPQLLRAETRVNAKVICGTRATGFVIFHEMIETVQSKIMFLF